MWIFVCTSYCSFFDYSSFGCSSFRLFVIWLFIPRNTNSLKVRPSLFIILGSSFISQHSTIWQDLSMMLSLSKYSWSSSQSKIQATDQECNNTTLPECYMQNYQAIVWWNNKKVLAIKWWRWWLTQQIVGRQASINLRCWHLEFFGCLFLFSFFRW